MYRFNCYPRSYGEDIMMPLHGANVHAMYKAYNIEIPDQKIIDFSTNTNCLELPESIRKYWQKVARDITCLQAYPSVENEDLLNALSKYHYIEKEHILVTNGTNEGIYLLASWFQKQRVAIVEPTYPEYLRAFLAYDAEILHIRWEEISEGTVDLSAIDVLFFCNPNNPTGKYIPGQKMEYIFSEAEKQHTQCVVDEAYVDFLSIPTYEINQQAKKWLEHYPNIIILRSLTKIFRIPGIRLGYLMGSVQRIEHLAKRQPSWSVNRLALMIGKKMLGETVYIEKTKEYYQCERERITDILSKQGWEIMPSESNFFIVKVEDARAFIQWCLQHGLVLRHTNNHYGLDGKYIRIGLQSKEENTWLTQIFSQYQQSKER